MAGRLGIVGGEVLAQRLPVGAHLDARPGLAAQARIVCLSRPSAIEDQVVAPVPALACAARGAGDIGQCSRHEMLPPFGRNRASGPAARRPGAVHPGRRKHAGGSGHRTSAGRVPRLDMAYGDSLGRMLTPTARPKLRIRGSASAPLSWRSGTRISATCGYQTAPAGPKGREEVGSDAETNPCFLREGSVKSGLASSDGLAGHQPGGMGPAERVAG
jgi:hypothetical protein